MISEKEKYQKMWEINTYRQVSPGLAAQELFLSYFHRELIPGDSLIDYGTGTGATAIGFLNAGLDVSLVDIAPNSLNEEVLCLITLCSQNLRFIQAPLWDLPPSLPTTDWSYCCDVLEHLPQDKLDLALRAIATRTRKGAFFQIFSQPETFGDNIHEELHLSLHDHNWWVKKLSSYFPLYATLEIIQGVRSGFFCGPSLIKKEKPLN